MTEQHDRTPEPDFNDPESAAGTGGATGASEADTAAGAGNGGAALGGTPGSSPEKDPADWVTGDEPMTGPQRSYLQTLSREAGVEFDENLTKAEASRRIDELQERTGRGASGGGDAGG